MVSEISFNYDTSAFPNIAFQSYPAIPAILTYTIPNATTMLAEYTYSTVRLLTDTKLAIVTIYFAVAVINDIEIAISSF